MDVGTGGTNPVSYAVLPGKKDVVISRSPTLAALGINVFHSLGECARKRNLSVQGVKSPNFKECRRMNSAVEALLKRGSGAPEPPDEAVEQLVSGRSDMGTEPKQNEHECAVDFAKAVETAAANGVSAGGGARLRESWVGTGTLLVAAFVATRLLLSSRR